MLLEARGQNPGDGVSCIFRQAYNPGNVLRFGEDENRPGSVAAEVSAERGEILGVSEDSFDIEEQERGVLIVARIGNEDLVLPASLFIIPDVPPGSFAIPAAWSATTVECARPLGGSMRERSRSGRTGVFTVSVALAVSAGCGALPHPIVPAIARSASARIGLRWTSCVRRRLS